MYTERKDGESQMFDFSKITVTEFYGTTVSPVQREERRSMQGRRTYGIIFSEPGQLIYSMNGKEFLSDPQHILLLPQGGEYQNYCVRQTECPMINFTMEGAKLPEEIVCFPVENSDGFLRDWKIIDDIWTFRRPGYRLRCLSGLYEILAKLSIPAQNSAGVSRWKYLNPAIQYLETHYNDPNLTNEILAEQANISTVYFRRLFSEKYGKAPRQYIQEIRMNKAKDLLRGGGLSVSAVAEAVGYSSIYHFSRAFRIHTGYTPSEFIHYYPEAKRKRNWSSLGKEWSSFSIYGENGKEYNEKKGGEEK